MLNPEELFKQMQSGLDEPNARITDEEFEKVLDIMYGSNWCIVDSTESSGSFVLFSQIYKIYNDIFYRAYLEHEDDENVIYVSHLQKVRPVEYSGVRYDAVDV